MHAGSLSGSVLTRLTRSRFLRRRLYGAENEFQSVNIKTSCGRRFQKWWMPEVCWKCLYSPHALVWHWKYDLQSVNIKQIMINASESDEWLKFVWNVTIDSPHTHPFPPCVNIKKKKINALKNDACLKFVGNVSTRPALRTFLCDRSYGTKNTSSECDGNRKSRKLSHWSNVILLLIISLHFSSFILFSLDLYFSLSPFTHLYSSKILLLYLCFIYSFSPSSLTFSL